MTVRFLQQPAEEIFQIPLSGLYADVDAGSGSVRFNDEFEDCNVINQLRIVQDWQRDLASMQAKVLRTLFKSRFATLNVPRDEQVARFDRYCSRLGLGPATDLSPAFVETA